MKKEIKLSSQFKTETFKAILSIVLFVLVYSSLFIVAFGTTTICVFSGIMLIMKYPQFLTIVLGIGLTSFGFFILLFLVKFLVNKQSKDLSHLIEITEDDEPELYKLIREIANKLKVRFPHKVFLSADVNAGVFHNSCCKNMILPVEKNLMIGVGLINTLTYDELKAVLSHEFGHFSQRTLKVGSYVFSVNHLIYDMLYNNESFAKMINNWLNISGVFSVFVSLSVYIIAGIQWILQKMYGFINKRYMALSREMEFHADLVAAQITGYKPLVSALLRLDMSRISFDFVLDFYNERISKGEKSSNLYKEQLFVLDFLSKKSKIEIANKFPNAKLEQLNFYSKSKITIKDQWASHPSIEERVIRLQKTNIILNENNSQPANLIFKDVEQIQQSFTLKIFKGIRYINNSTVISLDDFENAFIVDFSEYSFPDLYNRYYDNKSPDEFNPDYIEIYKNEVINWEDLFSDKRVNKIFKFITLKNDINTLEQISANESSFKTFDYDGMRYSFKEKGELIIKLKMKLEKIQHDIREHDIRIFKYFSLLEQEQQNNCKLKELYTIFFTYNVEYKEKYDLFKKMSEQLQFLNKTTPDKQILKNFKELKNTESKLKEYIKQMLTSYEYQMNLNQDIKKHFDNYISKDWTYFENTKYLDEGLSTLFFALDDFLYLINNYYFFLKKELLNYQAQLFENKNKSLEV